MSSNLVEQEPAVLQVVEAARQLEEELDLCGRRIWFTHLVILDEVRIRALISQIMEAIPHDVVAASQLLAERDQILEDARREAERILAEADKQANQQIMHSEIVRQAREMADEIIRNAQAQEKEMREQTFAYTRDALAGVREYLQRELIRIEEDLQTLDQHASALQEVPAR